MAVREMQSKDIDELTYMGLDFIQETGLGVIGSRASMERTLHLIMASEQYYCTVWDEPIMAGGKLIGFMICAVDHSFCMSPWLMMSEFYVRPEYRGPTLGIPVADGLVRAFVDIGEKAGVSHCFVACTSAMGKENENKFVGLFKNHGFDILGPTLSRRME